MLNFIGIGSALNPLLGNNGAFIKSRDGKIMFMIDCGENTYTRLIKYGVLDGVEHVHLLITHFHPDHMGSAGSLAFHMFYMVNLMSPKVTFYTPDTIELHKYFNVIGVRPEHYYERRLDGDGMRNLLTLNHYGSKQLGGLMVTPIKVPHDKTIGTYGYYLEFIDFIPGQLMYYSADSKIIPKRVLDDLHHGEIAIMYQDVSTHDYDDNVHLSLKKLHEQVSQDSNTRSKIWCMHLDASWDSEAAKSMGFKTVSFFKPTLNSGD